MELWGKFVIDLILFFSVYGYRFLYDFLIRG